MRVSLVLCFPLLLFVLKGCSSHEPDGNRDRNIAESAIRQPVIHPVGLVDQHGLNRIIHERKGKLLLLNIWATWCQPCVEEFPDLIKLADSDTLVELIGISVDYPDEIPSKVMPFLEKLKVPFKIYVAKFDKQEDFIAAVDSTWSGAVPASYFYNERGKKQFSLIGQGTFEQFEQGIQKMKKEGMRSGSMLQR